MDDNLCCLKKRKLHIESKLIQTNIVDNNLEQYREIIHNIRNFKKLTLKEINFINNLHTNDKTEIILLYDEILNYFNDLITNF